ncbi:major facilitator superfamily domain-containing protein [Xylariaceae sp. FL0255]|nr:major facilitator superfamily domain-containing protein [Xylariaceae sp. FL0255]
MASPETEERPPSSFFSSVSSASSSDSEVEKQDEASILPPVSRKKQAIVLLAAFSTIALTIGYNQTYGVFQEYYLMSQQDVLSPSPSSMADPPTSLVSFVGTLCYGLTWAGGLAVSPLLLRIEAGSLKEYDGRISKYYRYITHRTITISGIILIAIGFLLASAAHKIWHLVLTQGLLAGIGMSLLYFPILSPAPEYFTAHRATAMGVILAGGGTGGLVFSPVIRALLSKVGGRWTLKILAILYLVIGLPTAWSVPRSRYAQVAGMANKKKKGLHLSRELALKPIFIFSILAGFLQSGGTQLPLAFIPSYTVVLGHSASMGSTILAAANAVNAVSRVFTGMAGDKLGRQNLLIICLLLSAVSVFALWLASMVMTVATSAWATFVVFTIIYSITAGGYFALFPALITEVFGMENYGAVNAAVLFSRGLGTIFGTPIGGTLLGPAMLSKMAYINVAGWDGALLMGATICCIGIRIAEVKTKGFKWIA